MRLGVWSALLALAGAAGGQQCTRESDVEYVDPDHYDSTAANTADDCCAACAAEGSKCGSWKWNKKKKLCKFLATAPTSSKEDSEYISGTMVYGPTPAPPAPPPMPPSTSVLKYYSGGCDSHNCTGEASMPDCPWNGTGKKLSFCKCPNDMKECDGCGDWPGGVGELPGATPQKLVIGFPGVGSSMFRYRRLTKFLVDNLSPIAGPVRIEFADGRWLSCGNNECSKKKIDSLEFYFACFWDSAKDTIKRAHARWPDLRNVVILGHSAGTSPALEFLGDTDLSTDEVLSSFKVERIIIMAAGELGDHEKAWEANKTHAQQLMTRAKRDGTQLTFVYDPQDDDSVSASNKIKHFWDEGRKANPGVVETTAISYKGFGHAAIQDRVKDDDEFPKMSPATWRKLAEQVEHAFFTCTTDAQCGAGEKCRDGRCPQIANLPTPPPTAPPTGPTPPPVPRTPSPVTPAPPGAPVLWKCGEKAGSCVKATVGVDSQSDCESNCTGPGPVSWFTCGGYGKCYQTESGYTLHQCHERCHNTRQLWACSANFTCIEVPHPGPPGSFISKAQCVDACKPPTLAPVDDDRQ